MILNKKGFTLIEIIAVIAILLIFTIISVPNITNRLNKNDDKKREIVEQSIIDAASTYCDFNECQFPLDVTNLIPELLDEDELNEYYSNIVDCVVEKDGDDYILKDCVPK
ncbi:MAG: prepilin-type N-terminal cleavage/methylation domain-containing protein [Bacilli bacterium]|nr:prepilin-type N-terminal cleavage/methylation domain-containing protein [Bacilli bacterium]